MELPRNNPLPLGTLSPHASVEYPLTDIGPNTVHHLLIKGA